MERVPGVNQGPMEVEGPMAGGYPGDCGGGCDSCGSGLCDNGGGCSDPYDAAWAPHRPLFLIGPTGAWVKADYLLWTESGMKIPALVTTGSTADANPAR